MSPDALGNTISTRDLTTDDDYCSESESSFSFGGGMCSDASTTGEESRPSPPKPQKSFARRVLHLPTPSIHGRRSFSARGTRSSHARVQGRGESCSGCCASTAETVEELRESVKVLMEAQRRSLQRDLGGSQSGTGRSRGGDDEGSCSKTDGDDELQDGVLERMCVRMDGLEVYAVVSALTVATSLSVAEAYRHDSANDGSWAQMHANGQTVELICRAVFLASSAASALLGLHATLVFSLITMYGRTAVGMDNMPAFKSFYENTSQQRYRGFHAFLYSIYAFLAQIVLVVTAKCPEHNRLYPLTGFTLASLAVRVIYRDTEHIVKKAGIIFAPRTGRGRCSLVGTKERRKSRLEK